MKKHYAIFILLSIFSLVFLGCNDIETESTIFTGSSSTTTTDQNWQVSTRLDIGINLDYSTDVLSDLNLKYDFTGDKYILFQITFPEEVEYLYYESPYFDYPLIDRVTIISDGFEGESLFDYIISELEDTYIENIMDDSSDSIVYYMDDDGNILKVEEQSEQQVFLRVVKNFNISSPVNDEENLYFTFSGNVAANISDLRQTIVDGCPSATVSEILDGAFTYTFMGYTFMYDEENSVLIDGSYHFSIYVVN